jgi:lysophospholipase L1-like esterase
VILMLGINDIGWPASGLAPHELAPSADDIIDGYKQLIARAHVHGMRIIGATLTPFEDAFKGKQFALLEFWHVNQKAAECQAEGGAVNGNPSGPKDSCLATDQCP